MDTCSQQQLEGTESAVDARGVCEKVESSRVHVSLRRRLWAAFVATLNDSKLPYCLLGAPDDCGQFTDSDVDFAVRPCDYRHLPQLLASVAARSGAQLVQSIEHETTATYFAIATQQDEHVGFLHPDCTTDYRRQGRLWISSGELLRDGWRGPCGYFRPVPDIDFKYYLTKQVLKQTVSDSQWRKLVALFQAAGDPREAFSGWHLCDARQIEQALVDNDRAGFARLVPHLHSQLIDGPVRESAFARTSSLVDDAVRIAGRIANPTGLFVQVRDGRTEQRSKLARELAKTLAPAFRRTLVVARTNPGNVLRALVESTLIVSPSAEVPWRKFYRGVDLHWQHALSPRENLEAATATVLSHLSERTLLRLRLPSVPQPRLEFESAATMTAS